MSKRRPPEYRRLAEFGSSGKPKELLKGFLPKGISHKLEVDHRRALLTDTTYTARSGPITAIDTGIATGSGTVYRSGTYKTIGVFEPSKVWTSTGTWSAPLSGGTVSSGGVTSGKWTTLAGTGWTFAPDKLSELSDEDQAIVAEAICEQVATHPIPVLTVPRSVTYWPLGGTTTTSSWPEWTGSLTYDEK